MQTTKSRGFHFASRLSVPRRCLFTMLLALLMAVGCAAALAQEKPSPDLAEKSIEDLMNIKVTSVSKKEEKLSQTDAAIYVITQEDIRRSGLTSIPELLRMVPGLSVAHIDANKWAITSRGFNGRFASMMLVLIDGRTVYSPLFSGVYWDVQDTLLEDIERIEVIRGPGATLWGSNAVNGVINVITKRAQDTQGGLITAGGGNQERAFGAARYGGKLGGRGYYRFFAKYFDRDAFADSSGQKAADGWHILRGGFRTDWGLTSRDSLTVHGDLYDGNAGQSVPAVISLSPPIRDALADRIHMVGGNILGRWHHAFSERSDTTVGVYYDRTDRRDSLLGELRDTFDLDLQHHFVLGNRQEILWGVGYRFTTDQTAGSLTFSFDPSSRGDDLFSSFVQDEIVLLPGRLRLVLGTKLEHNGYTGFEAQPSLHLLWTPMPRHAIWAAVSRAVRNPSRLDVNGRYNEEVFAGADGTPVLISELRNPDARVESVLANELGYRAQLSKQLLLNVATFYDIYRNVENEEPGPPFYEDNPPPRHLVLPEVIDRKLYGEGHGVEIAANWGIMPRWTLTSGYSLLQMHLHLDPSSAASSGGDEVEGNSPRHQLQLRSRLNLPHNLEFDTALYFVGRLPSFEIPRYTRVDTRLGWRLTESMEISVVGQNLQNARHAEFGSDHQLVNASQVKRSLYGKVTWRF